MRKSCLFVFLAFLFIVSCSGSSDPLIPCVTVSDCPDSSYSCFDGFCVHAGSVVDPTGQENGNSSGDTLPGGGQNDGGNSSENGENDNGNGDDSELPDPVKPDEDGNSESQSDKDSDETSDKESSEMSDSDNAEENDSSENSDVDNTEENDGEENNDKENGGGDDADPENGESDPSLNDGENSGDEDADNENEDGDAGNDADADIDNDADQDVELPAEPAACAAAIAALPHGGKYDWDDGTTQGFSDYGTYTYPYWNVVPSTSLPAEYQPPLIQSGNYSFGKYTIVSSEKYKANTNQTSALPAADLSQCSQCTVKAKFYVRGANWLSSCDSNNHDYLNPTCKGSSDSAWIEALFEDGKSFLSKACSYSKEKWTELEWSIPDTCKTEEFFFGFRFKSDVSVEGPGLVVDNLTIYATTKNEPKGEFESAENGKISGWACDPDAYSEKVPVKVRYYKNKDESVVAAERSVDAESERIDLTQCGGTYNHGFEIPLDMEVAGILGVGTHSAAVFVGDIPADCSGAYKLIGTKEFSITSLDPKQQQ